MVDVQNSKIEMLIESIETFIHAVASPVSGAQHSEARKELRDALADFLKPTLRLV